MHCIKVERITMSRNHACLIKIICLFTLQQPILKMQMYVLNFTSYPDLRFFIPDLLEIRNIYTEMVQWNQSTLFCQYNWSKINEMRQLKSFDIRYDNLFGDSTATFHDMRLNIADSLRIPQQSSKPFES